jgi:hypothetical protein
MAEIEPLLAALAAAAAVPLDEARRKAFVEVLQLAAQQEREACELACLGLATHAGSEDIAAAARSLADIIKARGKPITRWRVQVPAAGASAPARPPPPASAVLWQGGAGAKPEEVMHGRFVFPCPQCARPVQWTLKGFRSIGPAGQELQFEVACGYCQLSGVVQISSAEGTP